MMIIEIITFSKDVLVTGPKYMKQIMVRVTSGISICLGLNLFIFLILNEFEY